MEKEDIVKTILEISKEMGISAKRKLRRINGRQMLW